MPLSEFLNTPMQRRYSRRRLFHQALAPSQPSSSLCNIEEADLEEDDEGGEKGEEPVASRPATLAAAAPVALAAAPAALSPTSIPVQQQHPSAALDPAPVMDLRGISQQPLSQAL